ncbi:MAG: FG-GAP repeat protein [Verrucomicrobiaceae bacterium]|nr:FG-GAP repeat protein [Verrucomicrobiaceae bacterium]
MKISSLLIQSLLTLSLFVFVGRVHAFDPIYVNDAPFLKATNTAEDSYFGRAVAVSGYTLAVGAPKEDNSATGVNGNQALGTAINSGAVYVYVRDLLDPSYWRLEAYIKAPNAEAGDGFGTSVALHGDTLIVGAPLEKSNGSSQTDNSAASAGAAYVYKRVANSWVFQAYLKASNTQAYDLFGQSVAIEGNTAVIGAYGEDGGVGGVNGNDNDESQSGSGAAYVFVRNGSVWSQQAYLKAATPLQGDSFGLSVAISGNTIVAGAYGDDSGGNDSGAAYVFLRTGSTWTQQAKLKAAVLDALDYFGWGVSIYGDSIAVGARGEDSSTAAINGNQNDDSLSAAGAAYIFTRTGTTWAQESYLKATSPLMDGYFGTAVSLYGDKLLVGAPADPAGAGNAELYLCRGGLWTWVKTITHLDPNAGDALGISVSIGENWMLAGAEGDDSSSVQGPNSEEYSAGATNAGCGLVHPAGAILTGSSKARMPAPGAFDIAFGTTRETAVGPGENLLYSNKLTGKGTANGGGVGLFSQLEEITEMVLQTGASMGGAMGLPATARVSSISRLSANHASAGSVFLGTLSGTGITAANNTVMFVDYGTHVSPLYRTGLQLGSVGVPDQFLDLVQAHTLDRLSFIYHLGGGVLPDVDTGLLMLNHAGGIILSSHREGAAAPGGAGFLGQFVRSTYDGTFFSYQAKWIAASGQPPKDALFSLSTRHAPLEGDLASGTTAGERYGTFTGITRRNTETIIRATLTGSPSATNEGVWSQAGTLLVRKGDHIGGGVKLAKLIRVWGTDGNQLIIHAVLTGTGVTRANNQAVLCKPATGSFQYLARTGSQCPGMTPGCRLKSISAVDVDPISSRYVVLASLSGVPAGSSQALLSGRTTFGNDTFLSGLRLPNLILRKGQHYHTAASITDTITGIALKPTLDPSGVGGRGLGQVIASDGSIAVIIKGRSGAEEVVRLTP